MRLMAHLISSEADQARLVGLRLARALGRWLVGALFAVTAIAFAATTHLADVNRTALPAEAQDTLRLIESGGPFPFPKDGVIFGNRERQLPSHARGYYREYTVVTPRSRDRGARRIVCGGPRPAAPDVCYYTQDHYASFRRIAP
jgi:ribonuclease T1